MSCTLTLKLKPLKDKSQDIELAYREIWFWLLKSIKHFGTTKASKTVYNQYITECDGDGEWDEERHLLYYVFRSPAGMTPVSSKIACHWFLQNLSILTKDINEVISAYGYKIENGQVQNLNKVLLVEIKGELFSIIKEEESIKLCTDNTCKDYDDFTTTKKKKVDEILSEGRCGCTICKKIADGKLPVKVVGTQNKEPVSTHFDSLSMACRYPHRVKRLSLYDVYEIPDEIGQLYALEELYVNTPCLEKISPRLGELKRLNRLVFQVNRINCSIPKDIFTLSKLEILEFSIPWGEYQIPNTICNLKYLKSLKIRSNKLDKVPIEIEELDQLETLYISCEKATKSVEVIEYSNFTKLKELNLASKLEEMPETIFECTSLTSLNLTNNEIVSLPNKFEAFKNLEHLTLCSNKISILPESIYELESLAYLDIGDNDIKFLDSKIEALRKLECLELYELELTELPQSMSNCIALKTIKCFNEKKDIYRTMLDNIGLTSVEVE